MAEINKRYKDNILGKFYTDLDCIHCALCTEVAPQNFCHSKEGDHDIVFKQPSNETELALCYEALESCPVEAIGDDAHSA